MATTTTNFGWDVPTSTDLVKNGATAISTLGQDIDTTMAELKGGTTGQVLSKTSNTDMDFTWVAQDDSNAIQNSIVDAKGDLITATANDTPARLAVGNNGETLVADSSTSTGLRYQGTMAAGRNCVINGGMDIWQRGTSFSLAAGTFPPVYLADRWQIATGASQATTISRQATGDTTNLPNIQYATRVQRNSGQTGTSGLSLGTSIESANSIPFAGKTVTLSFYARAGANYSASGNSLAPNLISGTGTDQNLYTGFTSQTTVASGPVTLTTTWQRFSVTGTVSSSATQLGIYFQFSPTGTASTNDYYEITGVQIEIGSVATNFTRAGGTIQGEIDACRRYLPAYSPNTSVFGYAYGTNASVGAITFDVPARVAPTGITIPALSNFLAYNSTNSSAAPSSLSLNFAGINSGSLIWAHTVTAGVPTRLEISSGNGYILFTGCEL